MGNDDEQRRTRVVKRVESPALGRRSLERPARLPPLGSRLRRQATLIAAVYAGVAGLWIAVSDRVLGALVSDAELLVSISLYKGFAFVGTTALLLYLLLRRTVRTIERAFDAVERKEAERIQQEEKRLQAEAIVESTDDAIVSKTLDGIVMSWNPAAEVLFGYRAEEVLGRPVEILIPPESRDDEPLSGQRVRQRETIRLRKDGSKFPVAITFSPIWGPDESSPGSRKIVGVSEIVRDITEQKRAEGIAARERRFAQSLVETMPGIFYLYDQAGRFLRWNDDFLNVSGYSAEEIARMHPLQFFAGAEKELLKNRIAEVFEKGESSVEASFVTKSGEAIPYFFTGKCITFDDRTCLVGVGLDISERKRAEEALGKSEERYRSTLDNILEGCQMLDFDWRYLYLNDAAAVQNRRPNTELLGKRMPEVWPGIEESPVFELLARCMQERIPLHSEIEFTFPDGATGWFDVRCQPVPEGVFVLSIDISERKQAETTLREFNESLELKVAQRTRDLEAALERAEAADRIKSAFLATMSHELRTPLNSIIGFTGIVLQGLAGPLNPEQTKQLGMVQGSARHLLALINDVLDISKIEAGQLEVRSEPFDLRASVERAAATVLPLARKKGLTLDVALADLPEQMVSDQRRVEQILLNLLNNAIKFTDDGSIRLEVDVAPDFTTSGAGVRGSAVRVRVSDTGIGMRKEDLAQLFQPFRQIDSGLQRQHEGTGLGLAICRRLAELLGGTISAQSVWGEGSLFTVLLPIDGPGTDTAGVEFTA